MRIRWPLSISAALATISIGLVAIACTGKKPEPDQDTATPVASSTPTTVATIDSVKCAIQKSAPPQLNVVAHGTVPTGGWTSPTLARRVYVKPPADSIWEYDFQALPPKPTDIVTQALTPISAEDTWPDYPAQQVMGARIYGEGDGIKQIRLTECMTK